MVMAAGPGGHDHRMVLVLVRKRLRFRRFLMRCFLIFKRRRFITLMLRAGANNSGCGRAEGRPPATARASRPEESREQEVRAGQRDAPEKDVPQKDENVARVVRRGAEEQKRGPRRAADDIRRFNSDI